MTAGLLHLRSDVDPSLDQEFAAWCDIHHRELVALPGVRRGRRLVRADGQPGLGRILTLYDLEDVGALDTPAFLDHSAHGTPMPAAFAPTLAFERTVARQAGTAGDASGTGTLFWAELPEGSSTGSVPVAGALVKAIGTVVADGTVAGARVFTATDRPGPRRCIVLLDARPVDAAGSGAGSPADPTAAALAALLAAVAPAGSPPRVVRYDQVFDTQTA